jgi:hypothetical protein
MSIEGYWERFRRRRHELINTASSVEARLTSDLGARPLDTRAVWETELSVDLAAGERNRCLLTWADYRWLESISTTRELATCGELETEPDDEGSCSDPLEARRLEIQDEHTKGRRISILLRQQSDEFISDVHVIGWIGQDHILSYYRALVLGAQNRQWLKTKDFDPFDEDLVSYIGCLVKHGFI